MFDFLADENQPDVMLLIISVTAQPENAKATDRHSARRIGFLIISVACLAGSFRSLAGPWAAEVCRNRGLPLRRGSWTSRKRAHEVLPARSCRLPASYIRRRPARSRHRENRHRPEF